MLATWRITKSDEHWSTDANAWLTRDQLAKHYNSTDLVDEIVTHKTNDNLRTPHPRQQTFDHLAFAFACMR